MFSTLKSTFEALGSNYFSLYTSTAGDRESHLPRELPAKAAKGAFSAVSAQYFRIITFSTSKVFFLCMLYLLLVTVFLLLIVKCLNVSLRTTYNVSVYVLDLKKPFR
jgi:hypothetical protein